MRGCKLIVTALVLATVGCAARTPVDPDAAFRAYESQFVRELLELKPDFAIQSGDYSRASALAVPDRRYRERQRDFFDAHARRLTKFHPAGLEPALRADHAMIRAWIEGERWQLETLREWEWDPSGYNVATPFARLLNTDYAPLDERLVAVLGRLEDVPRYYTAARANLVRPTREHTQLAIEQNRGALEVFGDDLRTKVAGSGLSPPQRELFGKRIDAARAAIQGYVDWLATIEPGLTPDTARSFRLGRELYEVKFQHDNQSGFTVDQLIERAQLAKERLHQDMAVHARKLWPKYFGRKKRPADELVMIAAVIDKINAIHSRPEKFVDDVRAQIPQLEKFVRERDLVDQDPTKPLIVRETPPYDATRGVAVASIEAPGPFDPGAPTHYNVNPMSDFTPAEAESFLREYNSRMMQIVNIHEGVPGHYTQLLHSNRAPSVVKSLLRSRPMKEGWAVYAQRMMLENGWGRNEPELWLMLDKFDLRAACNTILDYSVHVLDMGEDDALALLMHQAFQTETEARGKWRRVQLTSVQLTSYFAGYAEIYEFREQQKQALGARFNLKEFHNRFLSYGSAPVKVIKELMVAPATAVAPVTE